MCEAQSRGLIRQERFDGLIHLVYRARVSPVVIHELAAAGNNRIAVSVAQYVRLISVIVNHASKNFHFGEPPGADSSHWRPTRFREAVADIILSFGLCSTYLSLAGRFFCGSEESRDIPTSESNLPAVVVSAIDKHASSSVSCALKPSAVIVDLRINLRRLAAHEDPIALITAAVNGA